MCIYVLRIGKQDTVEQMMSGYDELAKLQGIQYIGFVAVTEIGSCLSFLYLCCISAVHLIRLVHQSMWRNDNPWKTGMTLTVW